MIMGKRTYQGGSVLVGIALGLISLSICLAGCKAQRTDSPDETKTALPTVQPAPTITTTAEVSPQATETAPPEKRWKVFELGDIISAQVSRGQSYYSFLDESSMSMGLYVLTTEESDSQGSHQNDEIYYVTRGRAMLEVAGEDIPVEPGSIVYVKALVPHRFHSIEEDLQVLVIFSNTTPDEGGPDWLVFHVDEILSGRNEARNVWDPFLDVSTMLFGMYMLPESLGGDRRLVHKVDEVNIVVNGRAKFQMDGDEIEVQPGSIMFVKDGVGHYFHSLEGGFNVLILFEKRK